MRRGGPPSRPATTCRLSCRAIQTRLPVLGAALHVLRVDGVAGNFVQNRVHRTFPLAARSSDVLMNSATAAPEQSHMGHRSAFRYGGTVLCKPIATPKTNPSRVRIRDCYGPRPRSKPFGAARSPGRRALFHFPRNLLFIVRVRQATWWSMRRLPRSRTLPPDDRGHEPASHRARTPVDPHVQGSSSRVCVCRTGWRKKARFGCNARCPEQSGRLPTASLVLFMGLS